ncbi:helix-turn-helix domain-containing protein [Micrococcus luteus]|nr:MULTISPECIES: helix-turn-helix domain-containing protein [Micrococcus]MCV7463107.1 helix-turn-helix domain-containing protein [Micrococcus luteus]MCV7467490.1 helix-turn-helix domain-containing protein [Micrococcus luteus]MCV7469038.1 helix-turn-helix domain-containing protein [Micrococcus luteus]MCV7473360.1 helix-turn-helix domain-containing protein [Micrococcus luteus]MCV7514243.1 helix-turn-helix domain-containing protein [Micrococcus luteus]
MSSTLDRLIRVLSAFDAEHPALTVADLARRTELPLATAYR